MRDSRVNGLQHLLVAREYVTPDSCGYVVEHEHHQVFAVTVDNLLLYLIV